ncbi:MAG: FGGY-family carbohydrate kinase [Spirochaetes bacterium]|nr:FGGY-family carbohydrate kinase [Spirochaetota bacterium]
MNRQAFVTLDIGTSFVKCALIGTEGDLLSECRSPVGLFSASGTFEYEADPREWISAAASATRRALTAASPVEALAVAVSGNGPTLAFVDGSGDPIGYAVSWMDRSAAMEAEAIQRKGGIPADPSFYLAKVLRALDREPSGRGSARRFFSCPEYVAFVLCGEAVSYLPDPFYERYIWDMKTASALGVDLSRFPPYVEPAKVMGIVRPSAAAMFGLPGELPVVSAFPDFLSAVIGSGATSKGMVCDRSGTSEAFNLCTDRPATDPSLFSLPHAIRGLWNVSGGVTTSGKALEWLDGIFDEAGGSVEDMMVKAARAPPGSGGVVFLPYLSGERAPLRSPGLRGAFLGLGVDHDRRHLARAIAESIGFGLRFVATRMVSAGFAPELVRVSGAPARSEFITGLKADILGLPVETLAVADCELLGNACACAVALGLFADLPAASRALSKTAARFEPDPSRSDVYDTAYAAFEASLGAILPLSGIFSRLRDASPHDPDGGIA